MKNKKLKFSTLKIDSFITHLDQRTSATIKGATGVAGCTSDIDTDYCDRETEWDQCMTHSAVGRCGDPTNPQLCVGNDSQQNSLNNCTQNCI